MLEAAEDLDTEGGDPGTLSDVRGGGGGRWSRVSPKAGLRRTWAPRREAACPRERSEEAVPGWGEKRGFRPQPPEGF